MPTRQISIDKNELYGLIKKAVREVLHEGMRSQNVILGGYLI